VLRLQRAGTNTKTLAKGGEAKRPGNRLISGLHGLILETNPEETRLKRPQWGKTSGNSGKAYNEKAKNKPRNTGVQNTSPNSPARSFEMIGEERAAEPKPGGKIESEGSQQETVRDAPSNRSSQRSMHSGGGTL